MSTEREKLLILFVPTSLVLAIYTFGFYRPVNSEMSRLKSRYDQAMTNPVTDQMALTEETRLGIAQETNKEVSRKITDLETETCDLCRSFGNSDQRFETANQIMNLISQNHVSLISQDVISNPVIPNHSREAIQKIEKRNGNTDLKSRMFSLQGRYNDMTSLIGELSSSIQAAFPVSIDLETNGSEDGSHTWHLLIVM
ncbi:MAG: hypothetical protein VX768_04865 [Planctomycetota bacterium]|nr:hypothetical protein [Planctomycetota bacterium]